MLNYSALTETKDKTVTLMLRTDDVFVQSGGGGGRKNLWNLEVKLK